MKLPWYLRNSNYNSDTCIYTIKPNKIWLFWKYIQYKLLLKWIKKNAYPINWYTECTEITIDVTNHWRKPTENDQISLKNK